MQTTDLAHCQFHFFHCARYRHQTWICPALLLIRAKMKCWEAESKAARALPSHLSSLHQYISTPRPVACESESERQVSKHLAACCGKHFSDRVVQLVVREQSKTISAFHFARQCPWYRDSPAEVPPFNAFEKECRENFVSFVDMHPKPLWPKGAVSFSQFTEAASAASSTVCHLNNSQLDQKERDVNWLWKQIWISKSTKQTWRDRNEQNVCPLWCQSFGFLPIGHGPLAVELPALLYAGCSVPMTSLTSGSQAWSQQLRLRNPPCFQAFALHFGKKIHILGFRASVCTGLLEPLQSCWPVQLNGHSRNNTAYPIFWCFECLWSSHHWQKPLRFCCNHWWYVQWQPITYVKFL